MSSQRYYGLVGNGLLYCILWPVAIVLIMAFVLHAAVFPREFRKTVDEVTEAAVLKNTVDVLVLEFLRAYAEVI